VSSEALPLHAAGSEDQIERYSFKERICHWSTALAYTYCLATGLAFYTPYLFWIAIALGGGPTARFWHPVAGLLFVASAVWMHEIWRGDMSISDADREWLKEIKYYVTNQDERVPPQWRFNAGQKQFYWIMFFGAILLLISGLVMWFPEYIPFKLHWVPALAIVLHECAALLTIGAFIIHVYMSVFMVPGGLRGMLFGRVSRAWAWTHHRLWYRQVTGEPAPKG
jgi:formate dehydrogenase subunit gamma